ncbi:MAG: VOC family protein [Rhodospirillales bacterium]|nr:VOC family protein [Rhodospirillales bacterium]
MADDSYAHGCFCWTDLATTDTTSAKAFYEVLFGWSFVDQDMGAQGFYTLCRLDQGDVAGLYALSGEQLQEGWPAAWSIYVAVNGVDQAATDVAELGGQILAEPFDIPQTGRMAVGVDPQGALFCLWQHDNPHAGYARLGLRPGIACWYELAARDTEAAAAFYTRLFGWNARQTPMGNPPYVEFIREDDPVAGMLPLSAIGEGVPPHWLIYFCVGDCETAAVKAQGAGGSVLCEPFDVPDVGRIAVLQDPQGAVFAIIALRT